MDKQEAIVHNPGVISGISSLFKSLFGLAVSRVELAALELSEIRNHVIELLAIFAAAVLAVWFAIAFGAMTVVALAWESMGWTILLIMFAVFALITAVLVTKGLALLKQNKLAFPATMKELKNDREMLM
ncbi:MULTISPECIES: phage holin family protein [Massilia]|uniref:phage holin family protein n=1 Tax=Massilia TaxID=149698 RepID=UPI000F2DD55A|nr:MULTISPECIES: phage holin family protein [Massilia]MDY0961882.1 phage holin family protein [Massilia sp. CFBP9026]